MKTELFLNRHLGPRKEEVDLMLQKIGVDSLETLIKETIPENIRLTQDMKLDDAMSESDYLMHLKKISSKNKVFRTYMGLGYNRSYLPAVIQRNILENPGWYTAYTPYQAEIAQGRLEALLNFQTMVSDLTGMELANASLLDEGTAAAEAMSLLFSVRNRDQKKSNAVKFYVSEDIFPQTLSLLKSRSKPLGIELVIDAIQNVNLDNSFFGAIVQYPSCSGVISDIEPFIEKCKSFDIKVAFAADILSLTLLKDPGSMGADVVVGSTQRFGIPLGYGGPHAGYFATKKEYKRNIPGRIIGVTVDTDGQRALRMALQTREQHIKRDRATSNICTAQVLLAVMAGMYGVYHGPEGIKEIGNKVHSHATSLSEALSKIGFENLNDSFFDTIRVKAKKEDIISIAEQNEINFYYPDKDTVSISINETTNLDDLNDIFQVFKTYNKSDSKENITLSKLNNIPKKYFRVSSFMEDEVFQKYHSETKLM